MTYLMTVIFITTGATLFQTTAPDRDSCAQARDETRASITNRLYDVTCTPLFTDLSEDSEGAL